MAPGVPLPAAAVALVGGGAPIDLRGLAEHGPALLVDYKADCPASPLGAAILPRFAAVPALVVAAISQDGAAEAARFGDEHRWPAAVRRLVDPEPWPVSEALGIRSTPTWILVDRGGRIEAVTEGWSRDDANALAARAAALAGAPRVQVARPEDGGPAFRPG